MAELILPAPSETQKQFLSDHHKYVAFGGARGGGKSWAVRTKSILLALAHPGIRILIIRRTYPELRMNHILPIQEMLPKEMYDWNDSRKELTFPNGSIVFFRFCASDRDLPGFQGLECDVLFVDEATQFTEEQFLVLKACVRGVGNYPRRVYLTCNPGGTGHGWVKRLFVDRKYEDNEKPEEYSFIRSRVYDNRILMETQPDYVSQLETLPYKLRRAWLEGDWDIPEGVFFEEFRDLPEHYRDRQWTHVIDPFDIPRDWTIWRSFDWGYSRPFSCGWWALDYDGVAYRILEYYGCDPREHNVGVKMTAEQVFSEIHKIECEHPWLQGKQIQGVADPAIWASDTGESVEEVAARHGVYFARGDNQRIPGWLQVHYRLAFDENGYPMMYVFNTCKAFIRTVPSLVYDEYRVEDLDTEGEDHVADEVRYFCMARPIKPRRAAAKDTFTLSPQHMYLDINREDLAPPPVRGGRMEVIG